MKEEEIGGEETWKEWILCKIFTRSKLEDNMLRYLPEVLVQHVCFRLKYIYRQKKRKSNFEGRRKLASRGGQTGSVPEGRGGYKFSKHKTGRGWMGNQN